MNSICVFCGSSTGFNSIYINEAKVLGKLLVENKKRLIYGGGNVGLMGIIADEVLANGGKVTGVIPHFLIDWEVGHGGLTEMIKVDSMHERKMIMSELADGFIAMPGGFGTLEELGEILTWVQLSIIQKPVGILNVNGFYDHLIAHMDNMVNEGFLKTQNREMLIESQNSINLLEKMEEFTPIATKKWIHPEQT